MLIKIRSLKYMRIMIKEIKWTILYIDPNEPIYINMMFKERKKTILIINIKILYS